MDKVTAAVEESRRRSDRGASASKSIGTIVQIDSISIDIDCDYQEIEGDEHDNFSIRTFVADMWEKNWKLCIPFEDIVDGKNASEMHLVCRNDAGSSSHPCACKEKDGSLSFDREQIGFENRPRDLVRYKEDSDPCNELLVYSPWDTEIYRDTSNGEQAYAGDDEGGNVMEAIPLHSQESHPNDAVGYPSVKAQKPKHESSESDQAVGAMFKREKKLRSLVDIMELDKNSTSEKSRMGSASSSGMQEKSADAEADLEPPPVELDITNSTKSPRKKKMAVPEERSGCEPSNLVGMSKRLKSYTPCAEKTSTTVQMGDSESEHGASMLLGLRDNAKTLQTKAKTNQLLDTSKKKKAHINNRTMQTEEVPKMNDAHSSILLKDISAADAVIGHMGNVPSSSTLGRREVESHFPSFLPAWQIDRMPNPSLGKTPVFESRNSLLMHRNKGSLEDQNTHRRVALDLSLNSCTGVEKNSSKQASSVHGHTEIPDLNELFIEKMPTPHENQFPTVSESSEALLRQLERTPSCRKDPIRRMGINEHHVVQNMVNHAEPGGASDDIPMDIVELLAMHQHERVQGNSKKPCVSQEINNSASGFSAFYQRKLAGSINFPFANESNNLNARRRNVPINQGTPTLPQGKTRQYGVENLEGNQFRIFNSYLPSQHVKTQYAAPKAVPKPNEGSDLVWPPRERNVPFHLSITPNHSVNPNAFTLQSFPDQSYNGKTNNNLKDGKRSIWDSSIVNEGRIGSSSKSVAPVKAYSNEAIPAMQLLSLMDQGVASSSSFKMGTNNFLNKHSSPYNQHLNLKGNENQNNPFLNASLFQPNSHNAGISRVIDNVYSDASLRKPRSQDQSLSKRGCSKNIHSEGLSTSTARPPNDSLELGACVLNRNPADFTIIDRGNEFTISHKDLKPKRKRNAAKATTRPKNADHGQKKQRMRKNSRK